MWLPRKHAGSSIFTEARGIFSCDMQTLSCDMQDLVPWPGIEPKPPPSGAGVLVTGPPVMGKDRQ